MADETTPAATAASPEPVIRVLLPDDLKPLRYDLKLTPDLSGFTFAGALTIRLSVLRTTSTAILHAKELSFSDVSYSVVGQSNASPVVCDEMHVQPKDTTASFLFPTPMEIGTEIDLKIGYAGILNDQMAGFYRSRYKDVHGAEKYMASTQFEALDARRCFPCVDEPSAKAIYGVTLVVPSELQCFSNMPEASSRSLLIRDVPVREVMFMDTPLMSTYLLAFCVGEFDHVQSRTNTGTLVRVYTPPGRSSGGDFSLDCAVRCLELYDDFFGVPYPLPKLDMVAVPEFAMGAMENWGLVTYREVDLLIDPDTAGSAQRQRVCVVVAHELAHQWFGNLVTMAWWDDLWLNEGFASWTETFATHSLFPSWNMWDQFGAQHLASALSLDSLRSSHPIQVPIGRAEEVEEVFDAISYCKGGCVVRIVHAVLGKELFQKGLALYMDRHKYSNTETHQLWACWEEVSGMPIGELMASWTEQMGFPVLKITDETWGEKTVEITVEQSWFLADGSAVLPEEHKSWTVPILTCTDSGAQEDITWMRDTSAKITVPLSGPDGWIKLNAGQQVPLRVCPSPKMVEGFARGISSKHMSTSDRAGVLSDVYALVKAGELSPEVLFKVLSAYRGETEYTVWETIESVLISLDTVASGNPIIVELFRKFAKGLVGELANVVGWDPAPSDGHLTSLLRALMVRLLARFCSSDEAVVANARDRFEKFLENPEDVANLPTDSRASVFKIVLKSGGEKEYEQILSYFDTALDMAEKKHVLNTLGASNDKKLKQRTLDWSISGKVKIQDFFSPMGSVGRSEGGAEISWAFFQKNLELMKKMIGKASPSLMDACIVLCCGSFCTNEKADEIESFFKSNPMPQSARKISQMIESMRANASFLSKLEASECSNETFWTSF